MGRFFTSIIAISLAFSVASCGTLTGIPGHGGGKRFAVEQELLASTAKAVARDLPVDELIGQRVAIFFIGVHMCFVLFEIVLFFISLHSPRPSLAPPWHIFRQNSLFQKQSTRDG